MKQSKYSDAQIMSILKQGEQLTCIGALSRTWHDAVARKVIFISPIGSASFYKWRSKFGGMDASLISRMKTLEEENRRLKKMYAENSMQNALLKEALGKKW